MASRPAKPDLLRVYTNAYGEMQVDYEGRPLGILSTLPFMGYRLVMYRPSMFDRHTIELEILDMGPDYFKARPPYNTVDLEQLRRDRLTNKLVEVLQ
jgi:hypothetical protein